MTIRGIAARPERNSQGLWISVSCGVSVTATAPKVTAKADVDLGGFNSATVASMSDLSSSP